MRRVMCFLFVLFAAGASASEPDQQQISALIGSQLPEMLSLDDFEYLAFPGEAGNGRVSVEGRLITTQALYGEDCDCRFGEIDKLQRNYRTLITAAEAQGVPAAEVLDIAAARRLLPMSLNQVQPLYRETVASGSVIGFRAELAYIQTVGGFDFRGGVEHDLDRDLLTAEQVTRFSMIEGSDAYLRSIDAIAAAHRQIAERQQSYRDVVEEFLTGDELVGLYPLVRGQPPQGVFVLNFGDAPILWREERRMEGEVLRWRFDRAGEAIWLVAVEWDGQPVQAGTRMPIRLSGTYETRGEPLRNATLAVEPVGVTGQRPGGITGWLKWTGAMFVNHPGMPDNGWQIAPAAVAAARAMPPDPAQSQPDTSGADQRGSVLAGLQGDWQTPGGGMVIRVEESVGRIVRGGSGARPDGIDMLVVDDVAADGTIAARMRFGGGQFVRVQVRLEGDRLDFAGRGYTWTWERAP